MGARKIFRKTFPGPNFPEKNIQDRVNSIVRFVLYVNNQRIDGPVNAHLISWPSKVNLIVAKIYRMKILSI